MASLKRFKKRWRGIFESPYRSAFPMIPQHYPIEAGKLYGGEYPG